MPVLKFDYSILIALDLKHLLRLGMTRLYSVKIWFSKNAFFILCFTGRAFIMVKNNIKLVLEFQFDLKNPLKQPEMWIFEKWKIIVFGQNYAIFGTKGDLKPCIWVTYTICLWLQSLLETFFSGGNSTPIFEANKLGTVGQKCTGHFDSS